MSGLNLYTPRPSLLSWRALVKLVGLRTVQDQYIIKLKTIAYSDILKN
jgi:hypothetical protein